MVITWKVQSMVKNTCAITAAKQELNPLVKEKESIE